MARTKRIRRYRRSGRWSSNIYEMLSVGVTSQNNTTFYASQIIAKNPAQDTNTVSQPFTVKNIELSYYIDNDTGDSMSDVENVCIYIMYVPQGMTVTADYNKQHPEYIMAWKLLGSPSFDTDSQQYQPSKIKTRLSRRLNTGDEIIIFVKGRNFGSQQISFQLHGIVRWWTKAN